MEIAQLRKLVAAMRSGGFHDLELELDHDRVHLVLEPIAPVPARTGAKAARTNVLTDPVGRLAAAPTHPVDAATETPVTVLVKAERVGVFTLSGKIAADEPEFPVKRGQELGVIKGLNVQERIQAPVSGTIARVHVASGKMVEFGQPLIDIVPEVPVE